MMARRDFVVEGPASIAAGMAGQPAPAFCLPPHSRREFSEIHSWMARIAEAAWRPQCVEKEK
jgi:hypothetical protein